VIARDITGEAVGGASQLFDLINLLSNPKSYNAKLKELQDATAEYKKHIEVVGHADQILKIRAETVAINEEAQAYLDRAKVDYNAAIDQASIRAAEVVSVANNKATVMLHEARVAREQAESALASVTARAQGLDAKEVELNKLSSKLEEKQAELDAAVLAARIAREEAVQIKEAFLAKQKAFLESL
jgi:hypothetical protein